MAPTVEQHYRNLLGMQPRQLLVLQNIDLIERGVDTFLRERGSPPFDYRASVIAEVAPWLRQQRDGDGSLHRSSLDARLAAGPPLQDLLEVVWNGVPARTE